MESLLALLNALAAIPKIAGYLEQIAGAFMLWYIDRQTRSTLEDIVNAAAFSARAQTKEDRGKALDLWRLALSRKRVS